MKIKTLVIAGFSLIAFLSFCTLTSCGEKGTKSTTDTTQNVNTNTSESESVQNISNTVPGKVIQLTSAEFKEKVFDFEKSQQWQYKGTLPAIVDFYADWCRPCKMVAPIMDELAKEYEGKLIIYKVDVDQAQDLASSFGISSIPSILYIPATGEPRMAVGASSKEEYVKAIKTVLMVN